MRKVVALLSALVLVLSFEVAVASAEGEPYITGVQVTSAQVDRIGNVKINGYLYCQNMDNWQLETQGEVSQAMGRKTQLRGGIWGGLQCNPNGPTWFEVWSRADWGKFTATWMGIQIGFGQGGCDQNGCWWQDYGGDQFWVKATKM